MPTVSIYDMTGKQTGTMELSDAIFGIEPNTVVMHEAVVNYLANQRQGTQSTLTRSEVRGGGRKPWRQKGTGHARQGSIRAPQWTHGGIALGPKPRDYRYVLNKKVRRLALKSALSADRRSTSRPESSASATAVFPKPQGALKKSARPCRRKRSTCFSTDGFTMIFSCKRFPPLHQSGIVP